MPQYARDLSPVLPRLSTLEGRAASHRNETVALPALADRTDAHAVAQQLRPVLLRLNRFLRGEAHDLGVTSTQASLLGGISRTPGVGLAELAQREHMSAPTLVTHIDKLEALGLVTRSRTDPNDRRRIQLDLTGQGHETLTTLREHRTSWLAARLEALPPEALAAILAAIEPMQQLVDIGSNEPTRAEGSRTAHRSEEQSK